MSNNKLPNFKNLGLDKDLPSSVVNIDEKSRSNLFTWRGQFSPQLIEQLLLNYANENDFIFDPFLGSGTVLYECSLLGLEAAGTEINPAAVSFASIYELANKPKKNVIEALLKIDAFLSPYLNSLPSLEAKPIIEFEGNILDLYKSSNNEIEKYILFPLITGLDFEAKKLDVKRLNSVWSTLKNNVHNLQHSNKPQKCFQADARKTPLMNNSIDFVVTSPPYINVFNYHQNYRKSVEKVGIDVLQVARSEIGANRKFRQNRFLTVVQYCMDLAEVFIELNRICKPDAKVLFIVGRESNVRRTAFKNAELISEVAESCGFYLVGEQERVFTNKFGESIYEEILRFTITKPVATDLVESAREVGRKALKQSLTTCSEEVKIEIEDAILKSLAITTSPLLNN